MEEKLNLLSQKIDQFISSLNNLKEENLLLKKENKSLKSEIGKFKKEYNNIKLNSSDKSDEIKTKLSGILNRLEQLEELV
ncbi:MAG: hypothetical protein ACE5D6_01105 [Candidatus Zixiibacteriota bacterium]